MSSSAFAQQAPAQVDPVAAEILAIQQQLRVLTQRTVVEQQEIVVLQRRLDALVRARGSVAVAPGQSGQQQQLPQGGNVSQAAIQAPVLQQPQLNAPPSLQVATAPAATGVAGGSSPSGGVGTPPPRRPSDSSVEAVYEQQNALFAKGLTFTPSVTQTFSNNRFFTLNGFLALGAIFLGNINVASQKSDVTTLNFGFTEGLSPRFQVNFNAPYLIRDAEYTSVGANGSSSNPTSEVRRSSDFGDVSGGFSYQLARERTASPNLVLNAQFTAPTGIPPYGIYIVPSATNNNLMFPQSLPTGQGVWGASGGVSAIKTADPAILFGSFAYNYNFPGHFRDISGAKLGSPFQPGLSRPGNAYTINFGTAFALNENVSMTFSYQQLRQDATQVKFDAGGPWQGITGSDVTAGIFNVGLNYGINNKVSWSSLLGIGLTQDAPNVQFTFRVPMRP